MSDLKDKMQAIASALDEAFNGDLKGPDRKIGFAVLVYKFGKQNDGQINYISNGHREDVIVALKELLARWDGRYIEPEAKQ